MADVGGSPSRVLARMKKQGVENVFQCIKVMRSANFSNLKNNADGIFLDDG